MEKSFKREQSEGEGHLLLAVSLGHLFHGSQSNFRGRTASLETICCTSAMPESLCWMGGITAMHEEEDAVQGWLQLVGFAVGTI